MLDLSNHEAGDALSNSSAPLSVSRRGFAAMGAAAAVATGVGTAQAATLAPMKESRETIATPLGAAEAFFVHPVSGRHEALVLWAAGGGKREASVAVARHLAGQGFAVLLVDRPYHIMAANQAAGLHVDQLANREARALVAWLNRQDAVNPSAQNAAGPAGLGHGYMLRSISAAYPRLSLVTSDERLSAAQSSMMVAIPERGVASKPDRMAKLSQAVRLAHRAGIAA